MAKEQEQAKLISQCKYFDGMAAPADTLGQNEQMLWEYEKKWVFGILDGNPDCCSAEYEAVGLKDFAKDDGVPIGLKSLLFDRYAKCCWSMSQAAEDFKKFYKQYYQ